MVTQSHTEPGIAGYILERKYSQNLSVAPQSADYPSYSPYNYTLNNPIRLVDPDGRVCGEFINEAGDNVGNDGKSDNKVYVIKTTQTEFEGGAPSAGITQQEAQETEEFIKKNSGNTKAFEENDIAYKNSVKIEGNPYTRHSMLQIIKQDDGSGGSSQANRQEHGGQIDFTGNVSQVPSGPVINPSVDRTAEISYPVNGINYKSRFHSHISTTGINSGGKPILFDQAPSSWDINHAGHRINYVFGRRDNTTYIYGNKGVIATIPTTSFMFQLR